jgi:hypothetical protein
MPGATAVSLIYGTRSQLKVRAFRNSLAHYYAVRMFNPAAKAASVIIKTVPFGVVSHENMLLCLPFLTPETSGPDRTIYESGRSGIIGISSNEQ